LRLSVFSMQERLDFISEIGRRLPEDFIRNSIIAAGVTILLAQAFICVLPLFYGIRDLHQDYLMGLAIRHGENPYQNVKELWDRYFNSQYRGSLDHISPHTPVMAFIFVPLSYLPLWFVSLIWYLLSVFSVWIGVGIALRLTNQSLNLRPIIISLFAISLAGRHELMMGQVNSFIFLLMVLCYRFIEEGKSVYAGICLGITLTLKFFGWPILFFLIMHKNYRVVVVSLLVPLFAYSTLLFYDNGDLIQSYFEDVVIDVDQYYAGSMGDLSLMSMLVKMQTRHQIERVRGYHFKVALPGKNLVPVEPSLRWQSRIFGFAIIVFMLVIVIQHNFATGFHRALILSCLSSPISWTHYLVPLLFSLTVLFPTINDRKTLLTFCSLSIPLFLNAEVYAVNLYGWISSIETHGLAPGWVVAGALIPTFCLIGAACLLIISEKEILSRNES